jgi:hypothetical protein
VLYGVGSLGDVIVADRQELHRIDRHPLEACRSN